MRTRYIIRYLVWLVFALQPGTLLLAGAVSILLTDLTVAV